jgi:hypothetical protein
VINQLKIISFENNKLTYCGTYSSCVSDKLFERFYKGDFVYDDSTVLSWGPRLILGATKIPTVQEYDAMAIPIDKLEDITHPAIASKLRNRAVKQSQEKKDEKQSK